MTWPEFWIVVGPPTATALVAVISAAAWTAVAYLKSMATKFNEAKDREALDSAIRSGIRAELKVDPNASDKQLVVAGSKWALDKGAGDAVRAFGLSSADLSRKALSAIDEEKAKVETGKSC